MKVQMFFMYHKCIVPINIDAAQKQKLYFKLTHVLDNFWNQGAKEKFNDK